MMADDEGEAFRELQQQGLAAESGNASDMIVATAQAVASVQLTEHFSEPTKISKYRSASLPAEPDMCLMDILNVLEDAGWGRRCLDARRKRSLPAPFTQQEGSERLIFLLRVHPSAGTIC